MNGIDVSHHQGAIDWETVAKNGIEFAIIKAGGSDKGLYKDECFEQNYTGAREAGLHVGAYYFVGAGCVTRADGIADAKRFITMLSGKQFDFPVYIDIERTPTSAKDGATDAVIGFCDTMEDAGYFCGIYASDISGFKDRLNIAKLGKYAKWVARYGSSPQYVNDYGIWQYSETGKVSGISGNVDLDDCHIDYSVVIKASGKNGYAKPVDTPVETKRTVMYIPGITAADVQTYLEWTAALGAGEYKDTACDFEKFLNA